MICMSDFVLGQVDVFLLRIQIHFSPYVAGVVIGNFYMNRTLLSGEFSQEISPDL